MDAPSQTSRPGFRLAILAAGLMLAFSGFLLSAQAARAGVTAERHWGPDFGNDGNVPVAADAGPGGSIFTISMDGAVRRLGEGKPKLLADAGSWGTDLAVGPDGSIFALTDAAVVKFSPQGKRLATIGGFDKPERARVGVGSALDIAADGTILVADSEGGQIQRYKPGGKYIGNWGGDGKTRVGYPTDLAVEADGNVLVVDSNNYVVRRLDPNGRNAGIFGERGWLKNQIFSPAEIATDEEGHVYVADWDLNRIQIFDEQGDFIEQWGRGGFGHRNFDSFEDLESSGPGKVLVTDSWGIREFQLNDSPAAEYAGIGAGTLKWNASAWPGRVARVPTAVFNFGEARATGVKFCYQARMFEPKLDTAGPRCRKIGVVQPGQVRVFNVRVRIPKRTDSRFDPPGYDFDVIVKSANAGSVLVPSSASVKSKGKR